uniref:Predicted protein n=1 Tax=Physcomitrium patens TaxID=3218 RepID=A9U437_PHYPA
MDSDCDCASQEETMELKNLPAKPAKGWLRRRTIVLSESCWGTRKNRMEAVDCSSAEDRVPQRPSSSSLGTHFQRVSMSQLPFHHLVVRGQGARFCNEELVNITAFDCGQQE